MRIPAALLALTAAVAVAAAPALGRPAPPAPGSGPKAPPPAWIETARGDFWLAYSSYCWTTQGAGLCADFIPPAHRKDLPRIVLRRGEIARIHLGFVPQSATLDIGGHSKSLPASRILDFTASRSGILTLFTLAKKGDASFVARVVVR